MEPYYSDESVTLYHGDCREFGAVEFDAAVTDPPYGVAFKGKRTKWTTEARGGYLSTIDDLSVVVDVAVPTVAAMVATGKPVIVTPGVRNMFRYPEPKAVGSIYYPSGAGSGPWGFICSQPIYYYGPDPYLAAGMGSRPNSISSTEAAESNGHPCPKPIGTMRWLVNRATTAEGQVVFDPFAGSGSTLVAAKHLGRRAVGVEIEERYCEIAASRLAQGVLDFGEPA